MNTNPIGQALPTTTLTEIQTKLRDAKAQLPFLLALSAKQRIGRFKMSDKRSHFVNITMNACKTEPVIIPAWVNFDLLQNHVTLNTQLKSIETMLESFLIEVKDTRMQLGVEALKASTDVYTHVRKAQIRIPGIRAIFEALKAAYPGRGRSGSRQLAIGS